MKVMHNNMNRRSLLRGAGLLGLTSILPTLLAACGGGGGGIGGVGTEPVEGSPEGADSNPRETRTLQFDLSLGKIAEPYLSLQNSKHHRAPLLAHDTESRARHRQLDATLRVVPDSKLTHYLEDVDVPARALQLGSVWGKHPTTGQATMALNFLHVPTSSLEALATRRKGRGQPARGLSLKLRSYGVTQAALDDAPITSQIGPLSPPFDIATALIFQHPAITNLNPDLGADIQDRIANLPCADNDDSCTPYSGTLAFTIAQLIGSNNFPTTTNTNSWATLTTIVDPTTGQPAIDASGNLIYTFDVNTALRDPLAAAVKAILNDINNDTLFQGTNWQSSDGGVSAQVATQTPVAAAARSLFGASAFTVVPSHPIGSRRSGIRLKGISCDSNRIVSFTVLNEYIRSAGVYVQYYDGNGKSITNTTKTDYDDGDAYYNSIISPQVNVMGIPLLDGLGGITTNFRFTMPDTAASAKVYYGGLGLGGTDAFSKKAVIATILTLVLNLALPTAFLAGGVAVTFNEGIKKAFAKALEDPVTLGIILTAVAKSFLGGPLQGGIQSSATNLTIVPFLTGAGSTVLQIFLSACPQLSVLLAASIGASKLAEAVPFIGFGLFMLSTVADAATITETLVEVVSCPAIDTTTVSLAMRSGVQISRDPKDFQFPATARTITVKAFYDGGTTPIVAQGTVSPGQVDPITIALATSAADGSLQGVTSGGKVNVEVYFYSDSGCLVGQGSSGLIDNLPATATAIPVTITELLVPLDATTIYKHQSKLAYSNGAHAWDSKAPVPALTHANLCQGNDGAICALHGLTVNTPSGIAGYSFMAGGQDVSSCSGNTGVTSMNRIQNVFLGTNPDSGLKVTTCGETQPIGILYSPAGPVQGGQNFFLQQDPTLNIFHLRGANLVSGNFDLTQPMSFGAFSNALDSLCVVAGGWVVGVNRSTHKMEVLRLPAAASSTDEIESVPFAALRSGYGSGLGRLDTPVALASYDGAVLILEQGNQRVQAFDPDGNTVALFKSFNGIKTALMPLQPETGVTYLDIAVEGAGYMYVLSYVGSGNTPANYRMDLYGPDGTFLSRTTNVAAGNIAVDLFRNLYTLNYETVSGAPHVEPSLSQWEPYSTTPCSGTGATATTLASPRFAMTCGVPAAAPVAH